MRFDIEGIHLSQCSYFKMFRHTNVIHLHLGSRSSRQQLAMTFKMMVKALLKKADTIDHQLQILVAQARKCERDDLGPKQMIPENEEQKQEWEANCERVRLFLRSSLSSVDEETLNTMLADVRGLKSMCRTLHLKHDSVDSIATNAPISSQCTNNDYLAKCQQQARHTYTLPPCVSSDGLSEKQIARGDFYLRPNDRYTKRQQDLLDMDEDDGSEDGWKYSKDETIG